MSPVDIEELRSLCDAFQKEARDAFKASGGKLEAYNTHIAKATDKLFSGLLSKLETYNTRMEEVSNQVKDLTDTVNKQASVIEMLERKVKSIETRDKKGQKFAVKNNLIIRSSEKPVELGKFILDTLQAGSADGKRPANSVYTMTEIKGKDSSAKENSQDENSESTRKDSSSRRVQRVVFKEFAYVKTFWKGISKTNKQGSATQVASEVPRYLRTLYSDMEKAAYTMRSSYNKEGVKTRIVPKGLSLKMQFRVPDSEDWLDANSPHIDEKLDIPLSYKDGEKVPSTHPSVRDILKRAERHL